MNTQTGSRPLIDIDEIGRSRDHPLYYIYGAWYSIINRCKHTPGYSDRGVRLCREWRASRKSFIAYILDNLGERPSVNHSLDRVNNDLGYEPGNLRWALPVLQARNKRNSKPLPNYISLRASGYYVIQVPLNSSNRRSQILAKSLDEAVRIRDELQAKQ